jgi:hypothetical protein
MVRAAEIGVRNLGHAIELGDLGAARSVRTPFYSAAAQGTLYTPPRAAQPFIMKAAAIWKTLPGETVINWPRFDPYVVGQLSSRASTERVYENYSFWDPGPTDPPVIVQHFMSSSDAEPVISRNINPWNLNNAVAQRTKRYTLRIFEEDLTAHRWVRRSGDVSNCQGSGGRDRVGSQYNCWSVQEEVSIRAFILILQDWAAELRADADSMRDRRYTPAKIAAEALIQEIDGAIGALSSFSKMLHNMLHYGNGYSSQLRNQAVLWMVAAEHPALMSYVPGATFGLTEVQKSMVSVRQLADDMAGLGHMVDTFYDAASDMVEAAMMQLWREVRDWALEVGAELITELGAEALVSAAGDASSIPFIGQIIDSIIDVYETLSMDERPPGLKYDRFPDVRYRPEDLDTYGVMMYRAMAQHRARMNLVRRGQVSWPEPAGAGGAALVRGEYRPPRPDADEDVPGHAPPPPRAVRPGGGAKVLTPTGKTALAIGGGASAAGLVWWLWKRFGRKAR